MKVLWIWEIVIDKTYSTSFPKPWEKTQATSSSETIGWPIPSALALLSNLWCEASIIWKVWDDYWRYFVEKTLKSFNIKTNLIIDTRTLINTIVINDWNKDRAIIRDYNSNSIIKAKDLVKYLDLIKDSDLIIFDRHEPEAFKYVIKNKKKTAKIVCDPSTEWSYNTKFMAIHSDYPIFPIEAVNKAIEIDINNKNINISLEQKLNIFNESIFKTFIITDWKKWSYIYKNNKDINKYNKVDNEIINIKPLENIKIKDTNWAWDIFRWAFSYGLLKNWNTKKSVKFASVVSGLQCCKIWNLTAIPSKKEILEYWKDLE